MGRKYDMDEVDNIDPKRLHDDANLNYRVPGNPTNPAEEEYARRVIDEIVLRSCVLGYDLRVMLREFELRNRTKGYMEMSKLYEALRKAGIRVSPSDFSVLQSKYRVYGMFLQIEPLVADIEESLSRLQTGRRSAFHPLKVVDEMTRTQMQTPNERIRRQDEKTLHPATFFKGQDTTHPCLERWAAREDLLKSLLRIQGYCYTHGRRPEEFFKGFDSLKSGKITRAQFLRGLDSLATATGVHSKLHITPEEAEEIADLYSSTTSKDTVHWQKFVKDLSEVYAPPDLKKSPSIPVAASRPTELPGKFAGHLKFTKEELLQLEDAISWIKDRLTQYKANPRPFLKSYDKFNHGFVTPHQFKQVMSTISVPLSHEQSWIILKYYIEKDGFNYRKFLSEIEKEEIPQPTNIGSTLENLLAEEVKSQEPFDPPSETEGTTIEEILQKVKNIVYVRRLRPAYFFEQYDELKTHAMDRNTFMRALVSTYDFPLTQREYKILMDTFASPLDREQIMYREFLRVMTETERQDGLESAPLVVPVPYLPGPLPARRRPWTRQETKALQAVWEKIRDKVSLQDWDTFRDTKIIPGARNGMTTTRLGLEKTFAKLNLLHKLSPQERELLFEAFSVVHGREVRFDWTAFLRTADLMRRSLVTSVRD